MNCFSLNTALDEDYVILQQPSSGVFVKHSAVAVPPLGEL